MKKSIRFFVSIFSTIIGLFTGLVSCTDTQDALYMGPAPSVGGRVLDATTEKAIQDIRVELLKNSTLIGTTTTKINGYFSFGIKNHTDTQLTLRIIDVDGTNNGEYHGLTNTVYVNHSYFTNFKLNKK